MSRQIGITSNWTGEMCVIGFCQTVMAKRRRCVTGALQTFQQPDLERMFFRRPANQIEQALHLATMGKITNAHPMGQDEFSKFGQPFWIRVFVHTINRRNAAIF